MSPASPLFDSPLRPRFTWDLRTCPWTTQKETREVFAVAVGHWCDYHDTMGDVNPNKVQRHLSGLLHWSYLFARADDLIKDGMCSDLKSKNVAAAIVGAFYKRDTLYVVIVVSFDLITLVNTRNGYNELFMNFEVRFQLLLLVV